MKDHL